MSLLDPDVLMALRGMDEVAPGSFEHLVKGVGP